MQGKPPERRGRRLYHGAVEPVEKRQFRESLDRRDIRGLGV